MWEFVNDKPDVDEAIGYVASVFVFIVVAPVADAVAVVVALLVLQIQCGVGGGAGQALMLLLFVFENDGLRNDVCLNPLTGCNGYYRPAIRTQSRFSLLYQIPIKKINKKEKTC